MKSIVKYGCLGFCVTILLLFCIDQTQQIERKQEIEDGLSISLRDTLKASTYSPMYNVSDKEMSAELLRSLAQTINTDGNFDIYIYGKSNKGLLDVQLVENYKHMNGKQGLKSIRKTLIVEDIPHD